MKLKHIAIILKGLIIFPLIWMNILDLDKMGVKTYDRINN